MKPLVKWTGGKRTEIPFLKPHYPADFKRVIEPFAGGAAVAWDLEGVPAIINDVNGGLIQFYRGMQDPLLRPQINTALDQISQRRVHIHDWMAQLSEADLAGFYADPARWVQTHHAALTQPLLVPALDARMEALIQKHGKSKAARLLKLGAARGKAFSVAEQRPHVETAIQSALYEALREVYNQQLDVPVAWQVAAWWSVRVLCYSGMFRFSKDGRFNVPYGGISYNARNFADSFTDLFGSDRVQELARFTVEDLDFEALFLRYGGFQSDDFVFVDPPYDSAFSQYNVEGDFTRSDQTRLRDTLMRSPAKWMVVIKRTAFIQALYDQPGNHSYVFDKTYMVNFRNRHDRGVQHLVVTNYPLSLPPDSALRPLTEAPPLEDEASEDHSPASSSR